ncbi:MAG: hypothetical protein JWO61_167 [Candidatus Saccharibacteria bacterium]|nr:hypothetical protein [Candidatus Saccharibacteria bacterium]
MPSTPSLLKKLRLAYPDLSFKSGSDFHWDYSHQTVTYSTTVSDTSSNAQLLHEVAHALLEHKGYSRDIELIGKERDAWNHACIHLGPHYAISIDDGTIQTAMDSYRDWLHARSTCPRCRATGMEIEKSTYQCPACRHQWRVNEARICGLRRYSNQK